MDAGVERSVGRGAHMHDARTGRAVAARELSVRDAATACGVSESTIRRRLPDFSGAHRSADAVSRWLIPLSDLTAAGFKVDGRWSAARSTDPDPSPPTRDPGSDASRDALVGQIDELRSELSALAAAFADLDATNAQLRCRAEVAEAVASEREQTIRDLRLALSRIEPAGPGATGSVDGAAAPVVTRGATARADGETVPTQRQQRIAAARRTLRGNGTDG